MMVFICVCVEGQLDFRKEVIVTAGAPDHRTRIQHDRESRISIRMKDIVVSVTVRRTCSLSFSDRGQFVHCCSVI